MRGLTFAMLALIVVLLGVTGLLVFRSSSWPQATAFFSKTKEKSESTGSEERASPLTPEPRDGTKRRTTTNEPVRTKDPETELPLRPASAQTIYRFPLEPEIVAGTPKSVILGTFGPPEAIVTGSDLGSLHERLVYIDKSTGKKTHIFLLGGKVVGARTYTQ